MSRGPIRSAILSAALAMAAGIGAMPDLGQQRTLSSRPGSGLVKSVKSTGRPKQRRDAPRQAAAQAKRDRKNAKRYRDMLGCHLQNQCLWWKQTAGKHRVAVIHGK